MGPKNALTLQVVVASVFELSVLYPNVLYVAILNSLKDRRDKFSRAFFQNMCKRVS